MRRRTNPVKQTNPFSLSFERMPSRAPRPRQRRPRRRREVKTLFSWEPPLLRAGPSFSLRPARRARANGGEPLSRSGKAPRGAVGAPIGAAPPGRSEPASGLSVAAPPRTAGTIVGWSVTSVSKELTKPSRSAASLAPVAGPPAAGLALAAAAAARIQLCRCWPRARLAVLALVGGRRVGSTASRPTSRSTLWCRNGASRSTRWCESVNHPLVAPLDSRLLPAQPAAGARGRVRVWVC